MTAAAGSDPDDRQEGDGPGGDRPALLSALVTEHFVLQSSRSTLTGESGSRSSLYLAVLSSTLVATGFLGSSGVALGPFLACVLPVVIGLGVLSWARLVELNVEDLRYLRAMQRIRAYYTRLTPDAPGFFPDLDPALAPDTIGGVLAYMGLRPGPRQLLFTAAATLAAVNSAVAGIGVALLVRAATGLLPVGVAVGIATFALCYGLSLAAQWRRNVTAFAAQGGAAVAG
jgi:hypothetical protein